MSINYKYSNKDKDSIVLNCGSLSELMIDENIPRSVLNEISSINLSLFMYKRNTALSEIGKNITIKSDSQLGNWLILNTDGVNIINEDMYVSYDKIVNALVVATFEDNEKMSNKIMPLFKSRVSGTKEELMELTTEQVIDYILNNPSFDDYLSMVDGIAKNEEEFIYDKGAYQKVSSKK